MEKRPIRKARRKARRAKVSKAVGEALERHMEIINGILALEKRMDALEEAFDAVIEKKAIAN